jgi:hypothetical protein
MNVFCGRVLESNRDGALSGGIVANNAPTFGLWFDFRQQLPFTERYDNLYAECLQEISEGERLGFTAVWISQYHFDNGGYLPWPLVVAEVAMKVREMVQT